jgi:hypothetical protein
VPKAFPGALPEPHKAQCFKATSFRATAASRGMQLVLDEQGDDHAEEIRPRLPYKGRPTGWEPVESQAAVELPLVPLKLDGLTVTDDAGFLKSVEAQGNLPAWLKKGLRGLC